MARNLGRLVRDLQRRRGRERRSLIVAEGRRLVADALGSGVPVVGLVVAEDAAAGSALDLVEAARARGIECQAVPRADFDRLADTQTPSGVIAVLEWAPRELDALPAPSRGDVMLVLDAVQDPGNVGTMLRTAHALGAVATVALDGTADTRGPKVVRGAMGAHFRHPIAEASFSDFAEWTSRHDMEVWLAVMDGAPLVPGRPPGPRALVVGSEGHGVRAAWDRLRPRRVAIPMAQGAESLNAAVAAGIMMYSMLQTGGRR